MAPNLALADSMHNYQPKTGKRNQEASELRKTLKPLMEKRRRARINDSLNQLKTLILPLIGKDNSRYSKLEKADILEMTVRFLRDIPPVQAQDPADRYKEGYRACVERLSAILNKSHVLTGEASNRLLEYLQRSPELCSSDCHHPPKPHRPRIVLQVSPGTSQFGSPLQNQPSSHRPAPCPPQLNSSIWRPW